MKNLDEDFFEFLVATDQLDDFLGYKDMKEEDDNEEEDEEDEDEEEEKKKC